MDNWRKKSLNYSVNFLINRRSVKRTPKIPSKRTLDGWGGGGGGGGGGVLGVWNEIGRPWEFCAECPMTHSEVFRF